MKLTVDWGDSSPVKTWNDNIRPMRDAPWDLGAWFDSFGVPPSDRQHTYTHGGTYKIQATLTEYEASGSASLTDSVQITVTAPTYNFGDLAARPGSHVSRYSI